MTGNEVRKAFLDYFQKRGHKVVRSSSLVPADDPTLLFTNAGMVQFKRVFLGEEKRSYQRATTSQKCVRAGGKHNDLENVGYTARHHTFFEMLGNFSFGDYFKEKAIEFGWDLLTSGYGLPADRLWVSIYLDDDEAGQIWHDQVGVPEDRIVRFGEEDNFWAMGDTGPCGPCSEIHLDRGEAYGCGKPDCTLGCECDRFMEIWNLVFMQFNRDASGKMTPLPKPSIDTGLGLERMAALLQDVPTNFDTDLILPIMERAEELSGVARSESKQADVAMKVIADHSRAAAFLISDGVLPSNEGRGYVLRRIMRRAIRYGRNIGLTRPFLHETAKVVFDIMNPAYPELKDASAFITSVIKNEEARFSETLDYGLRLLNDTLEEMSAKGESQVPGEIVFKLYDTYGFPVDIVRDVARDRKLTIDMDGFDAAMTRQRERSRSVTAFSEISDAYRGLSAEGFKSDFAGYGTLSMDAKAVLLVVDGKKGRRGRCGHIGGNRHRRDAFLRRIRRPGRRQRQNHRAGFRGGGARHGQGPHGPDHPQGDGADRHDPKKRDGHPHRRRGKARCHGAEPHRHPHPSRGAAPGARQPRQAGRIPGVPGAAAVRLHPFFPGDRRADRADRTVRQPEDPAKRAGRHRRDGRGLGVVQRGNGAVRRKVRRPGAGGFPGRLFKRAVRRHPHEPDREHRPVQDRRRVEHRLRGAPDRGADRRGRASIRSAKRAAPFRGGS